MNTQRSTTKWRGWFSVLLLWIAVSLPAAVTNTATGERTVNNADATAFHELFKTATPITFRYGYPDNKSHGHIVVTHKPEVVAKP